MKDKQTITLYNIHNKKNSMFEIKPADSRRDWIDDEIEYMYRCLPITIANQNGWTVHLPYEFKAVWFGGTSADATRIFVNSDTKKVNWEPISLFGDGIVTFTLDFLVRTPPGVNLYVRGAPNYFLDGAHPLEGVVETDWLNFTFTMNWKLTRPDHLVTFKKDMPICYIQPAPHAYIENFNLGHDVLASDSHLEEAFKAYHESREVFRFRRKQGFVEGEWQKHYFQGRDPGSDKLVATKQNHKTKLNVSPLRQMNEPKTEPIDLDNVPVAEVVETPQEEPNDSNIVKCPIHISS